MGGFFGIVGKEKDVMVDVFLGTDYHSHLGTKSGGIVAFNKEDGLQRKIHNINNAPFRTKFENIFDTMHGTSAVGCINDSDPQPLLVRSKFGNFAICFTGIINNFDKLVSDYIEVNGGQFNGISGGTVNSTELVAAFLNQKNSFEEGISYVQSIVDGTVSIIILKENGNIIVARDKWGVIPVHIGKNEEGMAVSFEAFAYGKLGYSDEYELGAGEIIELSSTGYKILKPRSEKMRVCSFLWSYYGYPTSVYEGSNVELMRCRNGEIMAENEMNAGTLPKVDCVAGVPDSGTPHAIGFSNKSKLPFKRPFIKYTPTWSRSFTSSSQIERSKIAKMKMIPVKELIEGKDLLFVDDSIVRGTQIRETIDFLYENGAKSVHVRSACPPIMFGCKFLNFTRQTSDSELLTRSTIMELEGEEGFNHMDEYIDMTSERGKKLKEAMCKKLHLETLEFQTLDGVTKAIGIDKDKLCTYCWNGKE